MGDKPLMDMAYAFKDLANNIVSQSCTEGECRLDLGQFSKACTFVSPLIKFLGIGFKFAEYDYVQKVNDLVKASKTMQSLSDMIDADIKADCVRRAGSHTRNLLRVKRAIHLLKVLCEQVNATENNSLFRPATIAYAHAFAPFHGFVIRNAAAAGTYAMP